MKVAVMIIVFVTPGVPVLSQRADLKMHYPLVGFRETKWKATQGDKQEVRGRVNALHQLCDFERR